MSRAHRLPDYLDDMIDAARQACSYVEGVAKADFLEDRRTQQAVMLNLVILGEAATLLLGRYADFLASHPDVPWQDMRGMRNRIAHGYFDIDLQLIWDTVQIDLPSLLARLPAIREAAAQAIENGDHAA